MTDNRAELNGPVLLKKTYQNPDAEAEVLTVIGTAYKGPAFVPKQVVQHEADANIRNTFVNIFGETEDNRFRHLRDQFNSRIDSQGYIASENWFANGGEQLSYVRVLGIGNGVKNEDGLYTNSGFNVSDVIPRGSVFSNGEYRNPYAVEGGSPGSLSFLIKKFKSKVVPSKTLDGFNDYLRELDVASPATDYGFITDVILCPSGVLPTLHDKDATNQILDEFQFEIDRTNENKINNALEEKIATLDFTSGNLFGNYESTINVIESENNFIYLNGLNNDNDGSTYNTLLISKDNDSLNLSNTLYKENQSKNYYNNRILNKGHVFYATFQNNNSLTYKLDDKEEKNIKIITTRNDLNLDQLPDFNDFNDRYRTAKTPWIVSQPINRIGLSNNREELSDKVDRLFKIHALDDGEVGNRYRIKIHPQQIFYKEEMKYSIFSIYVYEYDCFNNSYSLLESYKDLDLNPDSKDFIGRRIGTQYKYYDIETKRVFMKGFYPLVSENIRIELHEDVVNHKIEKVSIPSGFEAYPHINFQKESFPHYDNINPSFYNSLDNVKQLPITYMPSYVRDDSSIETREIFENHWGPLFFPINNGEIEKQSIVLKQNNTENTAVSKVFDLKYYSKILNTESNRLFSPHYFYTKYFQTNHSNTNKNVLKEEADWSNSLFHLERIIYPIIKDQNTNNFKNNFTRSIYRRSGKSLDSNYMPDQLENYYQYLNLDEVLNDDINKNNRVQDSKKLSFDLFTYGGFDGVNILDSDKRQLNNDAIVRERLIEEKRVTSVAYERCVELVSGYENCLGDVLIIPGIREEDVIRKSLKEIKEENRLIYCSEIIGLTTNESIVGSFYNIKNESRANRLDTLEADADFAYRDLIKSKFSTFSLFDKIDYNDKNFMPLLGEVLDERRRIKLCPSIYISGLFAQTVADNVNDIDYQYRFGNELIDNENLKSNNDNFLINEDRLKKNCLNIMYEDNTPFEGSSLNLLTANTTFGIRSSAYRKVSTVRIMNHIKKRLEFLLIIGPNSILFDSFAKTNGIYQKTKNLINGLMTELRDNGIIKNFNVSIPDGGDVVNPDVFENLLRGKIYIQLNNLDTKDANLNTISLGELTKEIKSLTNTLDSFKILSIN